MTIDTEPATRQYKAKKPSFLPLTIFIIHLQANKPETKAARKPIKTGINPVWLVPISAMSLTAIMLAPMIGKRTIKKENFVVSSRFVPSNKPVAIVAPDLDIPGITANA